MVETTVSSSPVLSRMKKVYKMANEAADENVFQGKTKKGYETKEKSNQWETQEAICKPEIAKNDIWSGHTSDKNGLMKPGAERKSIEEGECSGEAMVMGSVETNKASLSIAEKVNLWDSKERTMWKDKNEEEAARRVIDVEAIEIKKEEVSSIEEGKSMEIEEYRIHPQEVTSVTSLDERKEEENVSSVSRENGKENDEETSKAKKQEASETLCMIFESPRFLNGWGENVFEGEEEYADYNGESENNDWVSNISRPRSYWEGLRKQREREVMDEEDSKKDDIIQNLIKEYVI